MAKGNDSVMVEVMNLLEAEPSSASVAGPDILALREQLAILVSTGKAKEGIGVQLTHDQLRCLDDKEVRKHCKRYENYVGAKNTETLIDSLVLLSKKALGRFVLLKDADAL